VIRELNLVRKRQFYILMDLFSWIIFHLIILQNQLVLIHRSNITRIYSVTNRLLWREIKPTEIVKTGNCSMRMNQRRFWTTGRKNRLQNPSDKWRKQKQRERNRIEGSFGHAKNHFVLDIIKYYIDDGPEIWVRLGLIGMNLQTAMKKIWGMWRIRVITKMIRWCTGLLP